MADIQPPERPLDVMSEMVDVVLVQIGKFFHGSSSHDPKHLVLTKRLINQAVSTSNQKFHSALDELEIEIIKAKSVMERDLASIHCKRAERDRAAGLLKTLSPDENQLVKVDKEIEGSGMTASDGESEKKEIGDVVMVDGLLDPLSGEVDKIITSETAMNTDFEGSDIFLPGITQHAKASIAIDTQQSNLMDSTQKRQGAPEQVIETPTSGNLGDTGFESMFNDTDNAGDDDLMDFDFSTEAHISQELLNETPFTNLSTNNGGVTNLNTTSSENIHSLTQGLESRLSVANNSSAGFSAMTSLPESGINSNLMTANTAGAQGFEPAPTESNFDDLFTSSEFVEGTGDFSMSADGNLDELTDIDSWWKSDG